MNIIYLGVAYLAYACQSRRVHTSFAAEQWLSQAKYIEEDPQLVPQNEEIKPSRHLTQLLLGLAPPSVRHQRFHHSDASAKWQRETSATTSAACVSCVWPAPLGVGSSVAECKPSACTPRGGIVEMTGKKKKKGKKKKQAQPEINGEDQETVATPTLTAEPSEIDSTQQAEDTEPSAASTQDVESVASTQDVEPLDDSLAQPVEIAASGVEPLKADCLVVGAGISGSTLAHNLYRRGVNVLLTEARDYVGGNVISHNEDGFIWEEGPNSFATQPPVVRIAYELGIADQLVFADESLPPWVNHNGKLHPLPKGKGGKGPKGQLELVFGSNGVLKFGLAGDLLSWPGKIKAAIGAFIGHAAPPEGKDETIREWVTRILGEEVFLRCIDPFVSGVYAGNPETLSMKAALMKIRRIEQYSYNIEWNKFGAIFYGGLARQVELTKERKAAPPDPRWPEFEYGNPGSFRYGLSTLPNAISAELGQAVGEAVNPDAQVKLQWKLTKIQKEEGTPQYQYKATFDTPVGERTVFAKSIVSTVPAHALSDVLSPVMPEAKSIFAKARESVNRTGIYYPPVYAVTVAYPKYSFKDIDLPNGFGKLLNLPGFGLLNPRTEGVRTLGTLWSSSLFPGRCPPDYNLLLNYIGGSRDIGVAELNEDEIVEEVDKSLRQTLLKAGAPKPKVLGVKLWPTAIPQYELGHGDLMQDLEAAEKKLPGLWVCGNYRSGVAFPDCVKFGSDQADVVERYLEEQLS